MPGGFAGGKISGVTGWTWLPQSPRPGGCSAFCMGVERWVAGPEAQVVGRLSRRGFCRPYRWNHHEFCISGCTDENRRSPDRPRAVDRGAHRVRGWGQGKRRDPSPSPGRTGAEPEVFMEKVAY